MKMFARRETARRLSGWAAALLAIVCAVPAVAQPFDCNRLAAQIAAYGRDNGGQYAAAAQKQERELSRTQAYADSIGCDRPQFLGFGGRPPQCDGINARIARMQANLQGLQSAYGGGGRAALQTRFDTYCGGAENYGTARSFFERLFDTRRQDRFGEPYSGSPAEVPQILDEPNEGGELRTTGGGSQALCVRTCDGGFFPIGVSMRGRDPSEVQNLCSALCPGTEAKLFTRAPGRDLATAVSIDGSPYSDLPNALKFQKTFDKTCTCKPAGKSWVDALADAERLLGEERKGDIIVTPEKAEELSRPASASPAREKRTFDPRAIAKTVGVPLADGADRRAAPEQSGIARSGTEKERAVGRNEAVRGSLPEPDSRGSVRVVPQ